MTANFVHSGLVHLGVNMLFVVWLGPRLERTLGSRRFLGFYLGAGLFAYAINDLYGWISHGSVTTGGASGCVLAVAVLYGLSFPGYVLRLYGFIRVPFWWIVLLLVASDVSSLFLRDGIPWVNHLIHLGGASFGVGYWLLSPRLRRRHVRI